MKMYKNHINGMP